MSVGCSQALALQPKRGPEDWPHASDQGIQRPARHLDHRCKGRGGRGWWWHTGAIRGAEGLYRQLSRGYDTYELLPSLPCRQSTLHDKSELQIGHGDACLNRKEQRRACRINCCIDSSY